jgi:hypothetical protein
VTTRVVLSAEPITARQLLVVAATACPELLVDARSAVELRFVDSSGSVVLMAQAPVIVQIAGEAERLLGTTSPSLPYYWLELHCPADIAAEATLHHLAAAVRAICDCRVV